MTSWATLTGSALLLSVALAAVAGCSNGNDQPAPIDAGIDSPVDSAIDAPGDANADVGVDAGRETTPEVGVPVSAIQHLVVIVQETHTFDNHFGAYCTATPGSNPTCTTGPACCEAAPSTDASGHAVMPLDDHANGAFNPNHMHACEIAEIDDGKMDDFVTDPTCGNANNVAVAKGTELAPYWAWASQYAIADRYFQPSAGQSAQNDMYLAAAKFVFRDNSEYPTSPESKCQGDTANQVDLTGTTIADLLAGAGVRWTWYGEGKALMDAAIAAGKCPTAADACPIKIGIYPCTYDPSDCPFDYYPRWRDDPTAIRDYASLATDLAAGTLPSVVFVKGYGFHSEHPGVSITLSAGVAFVQSTVAAIETSSVASSTLILLTYDEGGGYWDHVAPPTTVNADGESYGTRIPLVAIGPFARTNFVSHVTMEHSSILKFIEWNWLGGVTGQLAARDATVANIGSLLDPAKTGTAVPEL